MRKLPGLLKKALNAPSRKPRQTAPAIESLEGRLVLSTTMAGGMAQGNLFGDQSVVVALPIRVKGQPTQIQVMDTGDIGMGQQAVRTFAPFGQYQGPISLAVGDFLHKGYQQLIVSTTDKRVARVSVFDLFQTFSLDNTAKTTGVFRNPVVLQSFNPFPSFKGGAVVATGDFDGNGYDDMAVATSFGRARINVYTNEPRTDGALAGAPRQVSSFTPFGQNFKGGLSLAAGHLSGSHKADLIVGTGANGGSRVAAFTGDEVLNGSGNRRPLKSYRAFGSDQNPVHTPIQVQLVESIVQPDTDSLSGLDANGLTPAFTPSNNAPLARGTILAYNPQANIHGQVSVYSMVTDDAKNSRITLPAELKNRQGKYSINLTSVGYMFDHAIHDYLAPMALVANAEKSNISLIPMSDQGTDPVKNIFTGNLTANDNPQYDSHSFPFGADVKVSLPQAVKVLKSGLATHVSGGTSGMLPSRQVAYQSPFPLNLGYGNSLFTRYGQRFFSDTLKQTSTPASDWYKNPSANNYGPPLAVFNQYSDFPTIQSPDNKYWQESMIAAGLQLMNRGFSYQHHHFPAWFGPDTELNYVGDKIKNYSGYSYTPSGMQTPGLDCSDYSAYVVNMVTGQKIKEGVPEQATVTNGQTNWGTTLEGTANISINNDPNQGFLSWYTLARYYEQNGALATYKMLNNTLQPGDLLYYGTIPQGTLQANAPVSIASAAHVTIWTGQSMPIPGNAENIGVPIIMDSHGGNIQTGVDAQNNPIGIVEPNGPQLRAFFVPNTNAADPAAGYQALTDFMTTEQQASQNYYYFSSFTHAIRIKFPTSG